MSKYCIVTGKKVMSGNNVSHANNRTRRRFFPNLQNVSFISNILEKSIRLKVSTRAIRTIEHNGGIDEFLLNKPSSKFSGKLLKLKKVLMKNKNKNESASEAT